jgi:hypothetical protein
MHAGPTIMQITDSAFCKKRASGLGAMLVHMEQGGAADEGGGDSPSSSAFLQAGRRAGAGTRTMWEGSCGHVGLS